MTECKVRIEKNGFFSKIYINNNIIPKVKDYEVTQENAEMPLIYAATKDVDNMKSYSLIEKI